MNKKVENYIKLIERALVNCNIGVTNLDEKAMQMEGMSSFKNRNLLNQLVSMYDASYLEIGVWKGATFYSAMVNNAPKYAVAIDDWSEYCGVTNGTMEAFFDNTKDLRFKAIRKDCFKVKMPEIENLINIYFYDGGHSIEQQEKALTYFKECLSDTFIYICDDWNMDGVAEGTMSGISKGGYKVEKEWILPADFNGDKVNWWNGFYVAILTKK